MKQIKKVTLVGLGAIGSFFAPKMIRTLGDDFRVLAGGARKERLETQGVVINGVPWHFRVVDPEETGDPADLIILCVKDMALPQAFQDMKNQVGEETVILPVQNGVESEEKTAAVYGWDHVLYSLMRVSVVMKDGCASYDENGGAVYFGEKKNDPAACSDRVQAVKEVFDRCGIGY